eukprot:gene6727-13623_t
MSDMDELDFVAVGKSLPGQCSSSSRLWSWSRSPKQNFFIFADCFDECEVPARITSNIGISELFIRRSPVCIYSTSARDDDESQSLKRPRLSGDETAQVASVSQ